MVLLLPLALALGSAAGAADTLSDRIDRDYVQPAFRELQGALNGREPAWTPPVLPGTAQTAALSEKVRKLWLEPLMSAEQGYAFAAARQLASPRAFEPPAEPDLAALLPNPSISPAAEDLVTKIQRRFLLRLFPEDYVLKSASALGSGRADEQGPDAPDQSDLANAAGAPAAPQNGPPRRVADSTKLARGSGGAAAGPKLKPFHSRFSSAP
jgi:hypothetical protein